MIDNMLTLLQANSHVYVDVAGLIWTYPLKGVNRYIQRLVEAGFEDRVMFGTDQLQWPKLMAYSIAIIQNGDYLTPNQKRDILYNNACPVLAAGFQILKVILRRDLCLPDSCPHEKSGAQGPGFCRKPTAEFKTCRPRPNIQPYMP